MRTIKHRTQEKISDAKYLLDRYGEIDKIKKMQLMDKMFELKIIAKKLRPNRSMTRAEVNELYSTINSMLKIFYPLWIPNSKHLSAKDVIKIDMCSC